MWTDPVTPTTGWRMSSLRRQHARMSRVSSDNRMCVCLCVWYAVYVCLVRMRHMSANGSPVTSSGICTALNNLRAFFSGFGLDGVFDTVCVCACVCVCVCVCVRVRVYVVLGWRFVTA